MNRLSDFKPLAKVSLPGIGDIPCAGLTIIVGPNSSGKSQFLQDLFLRLCGEPRSLVVASEIRLNKPPEYDSFIRCLESEGYLRRNIDANNQETFVPRTIYFGLGPAIPILQPSRAKELYQSYDATEIGKGETISRYVKNCGACRTISTGCAALRVEVSRDFRRLSPHH
jgi:hypothetical protein